MEEKLDSLFINGKWFDLLELGEQNFDHPLSRIYVIFGHQRLGELDKANKIIEESEWFFQNLRTREPQFYQMFLSRQVVRETLVTSRSIYYTQSEMISSLEKVYAFFEREGNTLWMINMMINLCRNYSHVGRFSDAISIIDRALKLCKTFTIANTILEGICYHAKAFPYYNMGSYEMAARYNDHAYGILQEGLDDVGYRQVLEYQVLIYYLLGDDDNGDHYRKTFEEIVEIKPNVGTLDYTLLMDFLNAVKMMRSPRSRFRGKAEELFELILTTLNTSSNQYIMNRMDVHRFLLEILLKDLEKSSDTDLIKDIDLQIEEIRTLAITSGSLLLLTLIDIIKSRILQLQGEYVQATQILDTIENELPEDNLTLLRRMIQREKEMMDRKFKELQDIYKNNASINERIKSMELSDYLTKALTLSELEGYD